MFKFREVIRSRLRLCASTCCDLYSEEASCTCCGSGSGVRVANLDRGVVAGTERGGGDIIVHLR